MMRLAITASELEAAEVVEQAESRGAAFFEMELGGDDIVARDRGANRDAMVASGDRQRRVVGDWVIGVDEIEVSIVGNAAKHRMGPRLTHAVPSDLGDFERTAVDGRRKARHASRDNSKAAGVVLLASIEQHLESHADAEEGLAAAGEVVAQDLVEFQRAQATHCPSHPPAPRQAG